MITDFSLGLAQIIEANYVLKRVERAVSLVLHLILFYVKCLHYT